MGFKYTDAVHRTTLGLGGMTKYVLLLICERANNETGVCWPSIRTIARAGEIGLATVKRAIKKLEERGILTVAHRGEVGNRYRVNLDALCSAVSPPAEDEVFRCEPTWCSAVSPPVPERNAGVPLRAPNPSLEPVTEPATSNPSPLLSYLLVGQEGEEETTDDVVFEIEEGALD